MIILGAKGTVGTELSRLFPEAALWSREDGDVLHAAELNDKISRLLPKPDLIINCIAFNDVDGAEAQKDLAFQINAELPKDLALLSKSLHIPLIHFSTQLVFDGIDKEYLETSIPHPLSVYGASKLLGEQYIQQNCSEYYIVRTSGIFGRKGTSSSSKRSFVEIMLTKAQETKTIKAVTDEISSFVYVVDLAQAVKYIVENKLAYGIYHAVNEGSASWYEFAKEIFTLTGKDINLIPVTADEFPRTAVRPKKSYTSEY